MSNVMEELLNEGRNEAISDITEETVKAIIDNYMTKAASKVN